MPWYVIEQNSACVRSDPVPRPASQSSPEPRNADLKPDTFPTHRMTSLTAHADGMRPSFVSNHIQSCRETEQQPGHNQITQTQYQRVLLLIVQQVLQESTTFLIALFPTLSCQQVNLTSQYNPHLSNAHTKVRGSVHGKHKLVRHLRNQQNVSNIHDKTTTRHQVAHV
jgi:hypothetical protein